MWVKTVESRARSAPECDSTMMLEPRRRGRHRRICAIGAGVITAAAAARPGPAVLLVVCGISAWLTASFAFRSGERIGPVRRGTIAAIWPALALVAMGANLHLNAHPFAPSAYYFEYEPEPVEGHPFAVRRGGWALSPSKVHFRWTMPILGALGGATATGILSSGGLRTGLRRAALVLAGGSVWSLAFVVGGEVKLYADYLLRGLGSDISQWLGLSWRSGYVAGGFLGGYIGGWVGGCISQWAPGLGGVQPMGAGAGARSRSP